MLIANSTAILTDAFPASQRGMALGINQVAAIAGSFIGLMLGGLLAEWDWRAVFWVSVPIGLFGTVWAYQSLHEIATTRRAQDRLGRATSRSRVGADRAAGRDHLRHPALRRAPDWAGPTRGCSPG